MWISYAMAVVLPLLSGAEPPAAGPCQSVASRSGYVIVVERSGTFVHCRDGEETDTQPVSGEKVRVKLPPVDPHEPYRFRLVDPLKPSSTPHRRLFKRQLESVEHLRSALLELAASPESGGEGLESDQGAQPAPAPTAATPSTSAVAPPDAKAARIQPARGVWRQVRLRQLTALSPQPCSG